MSYAVYIYIYIYRRFSIKKVTFFANEIRVLSRSCLFSLESQREHLILLHELVHKDNSKDTILFVILQSIRENDIVNLSVQ